MKAKLISSPKIESIEASQLKPGQLAIVVGSAFAGQIVTKLYMGTVVSLSNCGSWTSDSWTSGCNIKVRPLPPGTVVEITSEV